MSREGKDAAPRAGSRGDGQTGNSSRNDSNSPASSTQPNDGNGNSARAGPNVDLAQALRDLARGEQAANSLEAELDKFDRKLNEMLTSLGVDPSMLDEEGSGQQEATTNGKHAKK